MTTLMDSDVSEQAGVIVDPDIELVEQAQKELPYRDTAYSALMKRHEQVLYRVCYRLLEHKDDAQDVSQEVMLKVFAYLPKFEKRSMFKTWLMQIARNTCFTMQSKLKRQRELKEVLAGDEEEPVSHGIATDAIDIDHLLSGLEIQDREVLIMRYIAELKFDEIADVCGLSLSAAKMRVYRATEVLKKKLSD